MKAIITRESVSLGSSSNRPPDVPQGLEEVAPLVLEIAEQCMHVRGVRLKAVLMSSAVDLRRSEFFQGRGLVDLLQAMQENAMRTGITAEMGAPIVAARERVAESVMPAAPATPPSRVTSAPRALRLKTAPFAKLNALPRDGKPVTEWENRQIHVAAFTTRVDDSTRHHRAVTFGGALYPPENRYDLVDRDVIQRLSTARARTE